MITPICNYKNAEALRAIGQYEEAIAAFMELGDYSDAKTQITETLYLRGKELLTAEDYEGAARSLISIKGYKDTDNLLTEDDNIIAATTAVAAERKAKFVVGNYVTLGTYPHTALGNTREPIEWLVLARDGNKALLISRYALDAQPYNTDDASVTWETCTLRTWLNGTFYNKAFSGIEQVAILTTSVNNSQTQGYSGWSTSGGSNTQDKVFLLSYAEANGYFGATYDNSDNMKSRAAPTAYAIAHGAYTYFSDKTAADENAGWWWLRSPGYDRELATAVLTNGSLGNVYVNDTNTVRPVIWVNIEAIGS